MIRFNRGCDRIAYWLLPGLTGWWENEFPEHCERGHGLLMPPEQGLAQRHTQAHTQRHTQGSPAWRQGGLWGIRGHCVTWHWNRGSCCCRRWIWNPAKTHWHTLTKESAQKKGTLIWTHAQGKDRHTCVHVPVLTHTGAVFVSAHTHPHKCVCGVCVYVPVTQPVTH